MVTALDRLGRSLTSIVNTVSDLGTRGIYVRTLRESIDTSTSVGRMLAGLTMGYNSGAVEGTVNRIKQLKAAMYGRAKPDLLRKLILLT